MKVKYKYYIKGHFVKNEVLKIHHYAVFERRLSIIIGYDIPSIN